MFSDEISFNDVPKAVAHLINKVRKNRNLVTRKTATGTGSRPMAKPQQPVRVPPRPPCKTYGLRLDWSTFNPLPQKGQKVDVPKK